MRRLNRGCLVCSGRKATNPATTLASPQLTVANRRDGAVSGSHVALHKITIVGHKETSKTLSPPTLLIQIIDARGARSVRCLKPLRRFHTLDFPSASRGAFRRSTLESFLPLRAYRSHCGCSLGDQPAFLLGIAVGDSP